MRIRQFGCWFRATALRCFPDFQINSAVRQQRHHMKPRGNFALKAFQSFGNPYYPVTTVPKKLITCPRVIFLRIRLRRERSGSRSILLRALTTADLLDKDDDD